jgi:hypothetical protein
MLSANGRTVRGGRVSSHLAEIGLCADRRIGAIDLVTEHQAEQQDEPHDNAPFRAKSKPVSDAVK